MGLPRKVLTSLASKLSCHILPLQRFLYTAASAEVHYLAAMLCYAMLCYAMLCYAMLCYAMLRYAMLCCAGQTGPGLYYMHLAGELSLASIAVPAVLHTLAFHQQRVLGV